MPACSLLLGYFMFSCVCPVKNLSPV